MHEWNKNTILLGTIGKGLLVYDKWSKEIRSYLYQKGDLDMIKDYSVYAYHELDTSTLWISTKNGIYVWRNDSLHRVHFDVSQINRKYDFNQVMNFYKDAGDGIWIFSQSGGIVMVDAQTHEVSVHQIDSALNNIKVLSVRQHADSILWIGTYGDGLYRYNVLNHTYESWSTSKGLPNDVIYSIELDIHENIWMSTNGGLVKYNKSDDQFIAFNVNDGLQDNEFNSRVSLKYNDNILFFGGINGMNTFNPDHVLEGLQSSKLFFSDVQFGTYFDGVDTVIRYNTPMNGRSVSLKYKDHSLKVGLANLDFTSDARTDFHYRLRPINNNWVSIGKQSELSFNQLSPGEYTLELGGSHNVKKGGHVVSMLFRVSPPWWDTWYARIVYLLTAGAIVFLVQRVRVRRLLKYQRLRTKISSDLHDEIGSILTGVAMQSEMLTLDPSAAHKESLEEIAVSSRQAMEGMRDIVWAIDSRKDFYINLVDRMKEYAVKQLEPLSISVDFQSNLDDTRLKIDPASRQQYYLIFKELITNIVKHARASAVTIVFKKEKGGIYLRVSDDGIGAQDTSHAAGQGLANIKDRVQALKGQLIVHTEQGYTTEIIVKQK